MVRLYGPFIVWDYIRWRRKILRLYYSLIIKGGDAKCCVSFAVEVETQNIASLRVNPHQNRLGASP